MQNRSTSYDCYWDTFRAARDPSPPLDGDQFADVAIIGGGYTGLSTAWHLKKAEPGLRVVVLEKETAGFGASGRNGGFAMSLFGTAVPLMKMLHGDAKVREAHTLMMRAIRALEATVNENDIDCDYERSGFFRMSTSPAYEKRIREEFDYLTGLGLDGLEWMDRDAVAARVRSPRFLSGCFEPDCGLLNPMKWLDGLHRLAVERGAVIHERSGVTGISRSAGKHRLTTPGGTLTADKLVYATNGYTHLLPTLRMRYAQIPAYTYVVATEPLTAEQRASIGWQGREGIEDGRNYMHYFRMTKDGRIVAGGGPGVVPFGHRMSFDSNSEVWAHLERFIKQTFPSLADVGIAHRWGGAFSMTADFTPRVGGAGPGAYCAIGCTGHGVALTHMNGQILRDLVLERQTDLTDLWFVNRFAMPMPPEPVRTLVTASVAKLMALDDRRCDPA
ncbi:MAG: NAD(P)/FAD-dependent oxidoreductase [Hyphomicrobiaceae bacterium]